MCCLPRSTKSVWDAETKNKANQIPQVKVRSLVAVELQAVIWAALKCIGVPDKFMTIKWTQSKIITLTYRLPLCPLVSAWAPLP